MASSQEQLDAIVGEALKALVDSGASPEFLGRFDATYRSRFAAHLNVPTEPPPDLKATITEAVSLAVQQVFADQADRGPGRDERVRLQVVCAGKRTSVSVRKSRVDKVVEALGSKQDSLRTIRELAAAAPAELDNRSAWLEAQIDRYLQLRAQPISGSPAH